MAKKYLFLMRSQTGNREQPSPAQMQEMYAVFNAWKEKFKENILDMGGKLMPGGKLVTTSGATDGPFVETKEIVGGYMFVSADSVEHAIEVAREMPMLMPGSTIEIRGGGGALRPATSESGSSAAAAPAADGRGARSAQTPLRDRGLIECAQARGLSTNVLHRQRPAPASLPVADMPTA
jgi:hypothetical protein